MRDPTATFTAAFEDENWQIMVKFQRILKSKSELAGLPSDSNSFAISDVFHSILVGDRGELQLSMTIVLKLLDNVDDIHLLFCRVVDFGYMAWELGK